MGDSIKAVQEKIEERERIEKFQPNVNIRTQNEKEYYKAGLEKGYDQALKEIQSYNEDDDTYKIMMTDGLNWVTNMIARKIREDKKMRIKYLNKGKRR